MFGYETGQLTGLPIEILLPDRYQKHHPQLRQGFMLDPTTRPMGQHRELYAKRKDDSEFPVEIGLTYLEGDKKRLCWPPSQMYQRLKKHSKTYKALLMKKQPCWLNAPYY